MKNAIMILCTNYKFLEVMLNNLPEELSNMNFIIVLENRIDKTPSRRQVKDLCTKLNIKNMVIMATKIEQAFVQENPENKEFISNYTMGMNILAQWYVFKFSDIDKILYVDDDVIFSDGIMEVFRSDKSMFKFYRLSAGPTKYCNNTEKAKEIYKELFDIVDGMKYDDYIKNHLSSGNRLLVKNDFNFDYYEKCLFKFFSNKIIKKTWENYKQTGKGKCAAFFLDEKFETIVYFKMGISNDLLKYIVTLEVSRPEKLKQSKLIKTPIWHNATCTNKIRTIEILKERKEIK